MGEIDYKSLPSILDIVNESLHLRTARIIKRRMEGASLRDVTLEEGITRTEARSTEKKGLEKIFTDELVVREDEYQYVYSHYSFEDEFYLSLYDGSQILYYLKNRYEIGFGTADRAMKDSQISDKIKDEIKNFYKLDENTSDEETSKTTVSDMNDTAVEPIETPATNFTSINSNIYSSGNITANISSINANNNVSNPSTEEPTYMSASDSEDTAYIPQYVRDAINDLWNTFQACGITEPAKILEQASIFFFLKYLDDAELKNTADCIANGTAVKNLYFDNNHQNCRWSYFHNLDASELLNIFSSEIIPFIKNDLRVDTNLTYARLVKNIQPSIADPTLLTKIISTIDSITVSSYVNLYTVFEVMVFLAGTDLRFMDLVCHALDLKIDDTICNAYPANDFSLSTIASHIKNNHKDELNKIWNKMHFKNDMFHTYNASSHTILISSLRLLLQDVPAPDIQDIDIIMTDCGNTFSKVIAKIPAKPAINQNYVRSSIRQMITANIPNLMYMYGCHELLKKDGICVLSIPHKNLTEASASHHRLREFYVKENTILGVINLPTYNRDLFIYQNSAPPSFHHTLFTRIEELTDDTISSVCSLMYSNENHISEHQDRSQSIFYVPDFEIKEHGYRLGFEEYSTQIGDEIETTEEIESLDNVLRRIYNTQADIDKGIGNIKKLLEKL